MDSNLITKLNAKFQLVIDLIALKKIAEAQTKLAEATEAVNDCIDYATTDKELQDVSPYEILLRHLQLKIDVLKVSLN